MSYSLPDRTLAPAIQPVSEILLLPGSQQILANEANLYALPGGNVPACRLDVAFSLGCCFSEKPILSWFLMELLGEGTKNKSANHWHLALESTGAYMQRSRSGDGIQWSFFFLANQWKPVVQLVREALFESQFPEQEIQLLVKNKQASMAQQAATVAWQANRKAQQDFFPNHPYGWVLAPDELLGIGQEELLQAHQQRLLPLKPNFFFSGGFDNACLRDISDELGQWPLGMASDRNLLPPAPFEPGTRQVAMEGKTQAALRIFGRAPHPKEEDYAAAHAMMVLWGGFFGSRLMKNIREEKGLTYGIGTAFRHQEVASAWTLATEVNRNKIEEALIEIQKEAQKLRELPITEEELQLVKNYMAGQRARAFDGPFLQMDQWIWRLRMGLRSDWLLEQQTQLAALECKDLQIAAGKWINPQNWLAAWAG